MHKWALSDYLRDKSELDKLIRYNSFKTKPKKTFVFEGLGILKHQNQITAFFACFAMFNL